MADRRSLAGDLRNCLAPGEPIVWRSVAATVKRWQSGLALAMAVIASGLIPALWLTPFGTFDWQHRGFWISGLFLVLAILTGFAGLKAGHAAAVVTRTHLHFRSPLWFQRVHSIARADIAEATVFDGSDVVLLHADNGDRIRLGVVRKARELVYALDVPARVWAVHKDPRPGRFLAFILFGLALGFVNGVFIDFAVYKDIRWHTIAVMGVAAVAAFLVGHGYRAWRMDADERRQAACKLLDPRWRGCEPYRAGRMPIWRVPIATVELWLVKMFYGMPSDCATGHAPEIIEPERAAAE